MLRIVLALTLVAGALIFSSVSNEAKADGCYTWGRTLSQGMSGEDVRQLQIRVAGYPGYGGHLALEPEGMEGGSSAALEEGEAVDVAVAFGMAQPHLAA